MDYDSLKKLLALVTYKEGWSFALGDDMLGGFMQLRITVVTRNSYEPGRIVKIGHPYTLPGWEWTPERFIAFVRSCIHQTEVHESDEWLRVSGAMVFDPHSSEPGHGLGRALAELR